MNFMDGANFPENQEKLVITCAPCNYGRFHYTVEELDLAHPLDREPTNVDFHPELSRDGA